MAYMKQWKKDYQAAYNWADRAIQAFEASLRASRVVMTSRSYSALLSTRGAQSLTDQRRAAPALRDWDRAIELAARARRDLTGCGRVWRSGAGVSGRDPAPRYRKSRPFRGLAPTRA